MIVTIEELDDPRVAEYRNLPDPELLRAHGVFVAEGRQVVRLLLASCCRLRPRLAPLRRVSLTRVVR